MRGNPIVSALVWVVYFGLTAAAILVDAKMQRAKAEREGSVDLLNRSPMPYLALGLICGPFPLIFYFGITRQSALGWLLGAGVAAAVYAITLGAAFAFTLALAHP